MNKFLLAVISLTALLIYSLSIAQDIYVYPNKKLADQGLIEYRRYTLEEARAYSQGGSFEPYLTTGWSAERRLTSDLDAYGPKAIVFGDTIYCTYYTIGPRLPYFIKSLNGGVDWQGYTRLADSNGAKAYYDPEFGKFQTNLVVGVCFWDFGDRGYNLGYFKSTDCGDSWGGLNQIFEYVRSNSSNYSSLCNVNRNLYFAYNEYDHDSIYVVKSTNWGTAWNDRGVPVAYLSSTPQPMKVRAYNMTVHLVWVNEVMPVSVRYSRSTNVGLAWLPELDIANDSTGAQRCYLSVQGQHVVVSWMGYKYSPFMFTGDMFIKQSYDGGITWDTAQVLTNLHYVWMGSNYIKDSLIIVTWQDMRYGGNNNEAMVRYSTNYGQTWSEETRLSYGDFDSHSPIACVTGNRIHVLWGDGRPEAPGLYYSNNDLYMDIDEPGLPTEYSLLSAYPNPFNSSVILGCNDKESKAIEIYNITGQLVKTLNLRGKEVRAIWNGTNDDGQLLSSGVYLIVAKTSLGMQHLRVTFLK